MFMEYFKVYRKNIFAITAVLLNLAYLTCRELVVQGFGIGAVFEHLRNGELFLDSLHLKTQEVSVYGLTTNCL